MFYSSTSTRLINSGWCVCMFVTSEGLWQMRHCAVNVMCWVCMSQCLVLVSTFF